MSEGVGVSRSRSDLLKCRQHSRSDLGVVDQHLGAGITQGTGQLAGSEPTVEDSSHRPQTVSGKIADRELRGVEQFEGERVPGTDTMLGEHDGEAFDVGGQFAIGPAAIGHRVDHGG